MNKKFYQFCDMISDVIPNIKHRATRAENDIINNWLMTHTGSEEDFMAFVDTNLEALTARCGDEVTDEAYNEYLSMVDYAKSHFRG